MPRRRGRGARGEPLVPFSVVLPQSLVDRIDLILLDPLTGRTKYGAKGSLVESLLRRWLAEQGPAAPTGAAPEPGETG